MFKTTCLNPHLRRSSEGVGTPAATKAPDTLEDPPPLRVSRKSVESVKNGLLI